MFLKLHDSRVHMSLYKKEREKWTTDLFPFSNAILPEDFQILVGRAEIAKTIVKRQATYLKVAPFIDT